MLASMAAGIANRASAMAEDLGQGVLSEMVVAADDGYVLAARLPQGSYLAITARRDASLGLLMTIVRKAAAQLADQA